MVGAVEAVVAIYCSALCGLAPFAAAIVMKDRREAHKAWFADGAAGYSLPHESGKEWARALPRLIDDRSISAEDASVAAALGVPGLPTVELLPTTAEIDARFELTRRRRKHLALLLSGAGAVFGAGRAHVGASPAQAALLGAMAAACSLMAVVDQRCRIITDGTIGLLCLLGACLRIACGQHHDLLLSCAFAGALCACMYAADAAYARLRSGRSAFGAADKKIMAAIALCSGTSGAAAAAATAAVLLAATLIACKDRSAKRAFGPYAAISIIVGATTSILT